MSVFDSIICDKEVGLSDSLFNLMSLFLSHHRSSLSADNRQTIADFARFTLVNTIAILKIGIHL